MPVWAWVAIGVGIVLLVGSAVAVGVLAWRAYKRRVLLRLIVRAEAVEASSDALIEVVERLASGSDAELETFADDPDSSERHVLEEIASRAGLLVTELDHMALPKDLIDVAEALSDAAYLVSTQAGSVSRDDQGVVALERLGDVDLAQVRAYTEKGRALLAMSCSECGLEETSVYGGGLYL